MLGLSLSPVPALATSLEFAITAPTGGTISYAGGLSPLIGTGITVDSVLGVNTPLENGELRNCLSCKLSFTTGAHTGSPTAWNWGGPGPVTLTGTVDLDKSGTVTPGDATGFLLNGTFGTANVQAGGSTFRLLFGSFSDTKNATLTSFYGLPVSPYTGNLNLGFSALGSPGSTFTSGSVGSGSLSNSIPEESSLLLLGSGLLFSLAFWGQRKFNGVK